MTAAREIVNYEIDPSSLFFGYVISYTVGGVNDSGVPAGGTITYTYKDLNPERDMPPGVSLDPTLLLSIPTLQVNVRDRHGNQAQYIYGGGKTLLDYRERTRGLRSGEPAELVTTLNHQRDRLLAERALPEGNKVAFTFNATSADRFQQGNLIRTVLMPDATRGGDHPKIEMVYVYEPIYSRPCLNVYPRGTDVLKNGFTPPIPDPAARTMPGPVRPAEAAQPALRPSRVLRFPGVRRESHRCSRQSN